MKQKLPEKFNLNKIILSIILLLGFTCINAQTLKHSYNFETDASDGTGTANGTLSESGARVANGMLVLEGGSLTLPGPTIGISSYTDITFEVVFQQGEGNDAFHTLLAMGDYGSVGSNYFQIQPARTDDVLRSAISVNNTTEPWTVEIGVNDPNGEITDNNMHHVVVTISGSEMVMYLDGVSSGSVAMSGDNQLANVSSAFASLGESVYGGDPRWYGSVDEFNIYDGIMDATTVATRAQNLLSIDNFQTRTFSIYPNPANKGDFAIQIGSGQTGTKMNVKIYNILGKEILDKDYAVNSATIKIREILESGIYLVKVDNKDSRKLIVR